MRAQLSTEFLIVFTILLGIFALFQAYYYLEYANLSEGKTLVSARKLARKLGLLVNLAAHNPGYSAEFTVPPTLDNEENFTLNVYNYSLDVKWDENEIVQSLQTIKVVNSTGDQNFALSQGAYWVNNSPEEVVIAEK
ncbi:MAG: hypothetical protein ACE5DI_02755 [Candidatus Micrarchaeia archaeon]